jgi:hypothetical protein
MPNPDFEPIIGSSFDAIAGQRAGWAGFNNNVDRASLDSAERANQQRNAYFYAQQARADEMARQNAIATIANNRDAIAQQNFNTSEANRLSEANQNYKLRADQLAADTAYGKTAQDTKDSDAMYATAQYEAEKGIFDPKNYPTLAPDHLAFLTRLNAMSAAPKALDAAYAQNVWANAGERANAGNYLKNITEDQTPIPDKQSILPPWYAGPLAPAVFAGKALGKYFGGGSRIEPNPDAAARLASERAAITPTLTGKNSGVTIDAGTGRLIPDATLNPAWIPGSALPAPVAAPVATSTTVAPTNNGAIVYQKGMARVANQSYLIGGKTYVWDGKNFVSND